MCFRLSHLQNKTIMKTEIYFSPLLKIVCKVIRSLFSTVILSLCALSSHAQSVDLGNVNIGLVYPISTNGKDAAADTNVFSFNLIAGVSAAEEGFSFSGLTNVVHNYVSGFQFAGFSNHIGLDTEGFLFAGFANTYGRGQGFQGAGFTNVARGDVDGAQFAGFHNKAQDVTGAQFAGFSNIASDVDGSQFAGFINTTKKIEGSQFAGFANVTSGDSKGSQFAGFLNKADDLQGSQFAGFINVAKKVRGAQFAGFINIADSSDHPIGVLNIIRKGEKSIGISTDETLTTLLSFRSGGRVTYGILGAGYNFKNSREVYAFEAGFGAHIWITNEVRVNTELATIMLEDFKYGEYFKSSFRFMPAVRLAKPVELFAGAVFNYVNTNTQEGRELSDHYIHKWTNSNNNFQGFYFGYMAGLHFIF